MDVGYRNGPAGAGNTPEPGPQGVGPMDKASVAYVLCRIEDDSSLTPVSERGGGHPNPTGRRMQDHPHWQITGISKRVGQLALRGPPGFSSPAARSRTGPGRGELSRTSA